MQSIVNFLTAHAQANPNGIAFTFIEDDGAKHQISFSDLHRAAQSISTCLTGKVKSGEAVVLLFPQGLEYIQAFLGCLYAGIVAVPLYPPKSRNHAERVISAIKDCDAKLALSCDEYKPALDQDLTSLPVIGFAELSRNLPVTSMPEPTPKQLAFLQYTSGSTGSPKGVMVSHGNILANLKSLQEATKCSASDVFCNWLPLFHDLGLVNTVLLPIYLGSHSVLMSPARFVKRPMAWFEAISEYRASICGAPNFAFDHCINRTHDIQENSINLSSWRVAFNAAEPIDINTIQKFSQCFSGLGFKESAFYPSYGMAEATVFISGCASSMSVLQQSFNADSLKIGRVEIDQKSRNKQTLVACGMAQADHCIKIVEPELAVELSEDRVGEIWFSGPSVAQGYWNDIEKTKASFGARLPNDDREYLRTGDLGFMHHGQLFISGRMKDVLIIKGRNYYPQDIEGVAYHSSNGLNQGGAAAFEVHGRAVLVQEVDVRSQKQFDYAYACSNIQSAIYEHFEILLDDIVFVRARKISKTSSGKIQRALTKKQYMSGDINALYSLKAATIQYAQQPVAPTTALTALEERLCCLWQEVLGIECISIDDNFLMLGGHSLFATRLITKISQDLNCHISIKDLFQSLTIRNLAAIIETAAPSKTSSIVKALEAQKWELSFSQQRLWLLDQIEGGNSHYNMPGALKLSGALDLNTLHQVFSSILERHESLRTCFAVDENGQSLQVIQAAVSFHVPLVDLSEVEEGVRQLQLAQIISDEANRIFDLSRDLMLRAQLIRIAADEHILLVTMHHIASDGWSMSILINEFSALYSAYVEGKENPLPPLAIQYADYAHWQRNLLQGEVLDQQLGYWTKQLASLPVVHSLPLDHPRPAIQRFAGTTHHSQLDVATSKKLNQLCQSNGATLFMGLHAAFSVLLSRYSNETDIVVGSPIANREQAEVAGLIGFFVNTLVLRSDLSENPSFTSLLKQSKTMLLDAYAHQQVPFEQIVERLQPERSLSHSALFQVMLILQNNAVGVLELPGLTLNPVAQNGTGVAKYDLTLTAMETPQGLYLQWEYNTDLFAQDTIARMANHFELLLTSLLKTPNDNVFNVDMLGAQERQQLLIDWNETSVDYPNDKCIHELFEMQVENNPDAIAAVFENEQLTYGQLNQKANQVAHYLINEKQVKPDTLVGICVERSLDMVVGILAILKAGGAYVPLDPEYPEARLQYMLEDANLTTVLTQSHLRETTPVSDKQAVCLDDKNIQQQLQSQSTQNPNKNELGLTSNHLAYVIYTSGSTGNQKGVLAPHRSIHNRVSWMEQQFPALADDVFCQKTAAGFVDHVAEIFQALAYGKRLIVVRTRDTLNADDFIRIVAKHQITRLTLVPSLLKFLIQQGTLAAMPSLRLVISSGEALQLEETRSFYRALPATRLLNLYGSSEVGADVTAYLIENPSAKVEFTYQSLKWQVSIGKPIANTQLMIFDVNSNLVPRGVCGELYAGGAGLARGYLNRADLTAEKFIPNPFYDKTNPASSERLYKTGDLVRWLSDGNLEFLGRIDHQVKIRGFRIELGEIENTLSTHAAVKDAIVLAKESAVTGDKRLVAYVVMEGKEGIFYSENGSAATAGSGVIETLRYHLSQTLPDYMVPSAFVLLESLPLTPNGKVDRKALPEPDVSAQQNSYLAPRTETEKVLCDIWQEILGVERVGIADNFFHRGGHSLSATRLVARINQNFGVTLPLKILFSSQNIERLVQELLLLDTTLVSPRLVSVSREQVLLSSFAQQRLWLLNQIEGSAHYNMPSALKLSGALNLDALHQTFTSIIERHESLRTCFGVDEKGQLLQVIQSSVSFFVSLIDLSEVEEGVRQLQLTQCISDEANRVFDLNRDLMLRAQLIKVASNEHIVLVTMHHIASDGWSMSILINEFSALYSAYVQGKESPLPPLRIQYADYAHWQRNWLQGEVRDQQLGYWEKQLSGLPVVHNLPLDHPRPTHQSFAGATYGSTIDAVTSKTLNSLCQSQGATLFMGLHAGFSVLLSRYSSETDIVVGSPIANREQAEIAGLIGFFVNTLVLRSNLSESPCFTSLLNQSKTMLLDAYAHQQVPFEQIVERLQPERSLSHSALFQIMLVLANNEQGTLELPDLTLSPVEQSGAGIAKFDLTLNMAESDDGLYLSWEYSTDLFEQDTIARMANHFELLLKALLTQPNESVFKVDMLSEQERQQLLIDWNYTQTDYPNDKCVHELFATQAKNNPAAIAAVFENQQLTYSELNNKANQLAHYLISEKQVKPDTLVGICVERSLEMVIGILAILKAGGAYVPLDPEYPEARLKYMLEDARLTTVLTQRHLRETTPVTDEQAVCLDSVEFKQQLETYPTTNPELTQQGLHSCHLAYVIYTSGSTGNPKGVMIQHSNTVAFLSWAMNIFSKSQLACVLASTSVCFDLSIFEMFAPLSMGGSVLIVKNILALQAREYPYNISLINTVPSAIEMLLAGNYIPASVKTINLAGEPLKQKIVDQLYGAGIDAVYDLYGPSEDTTYSTYALRTKNGISSIGKPIENSQVYVLHQSGQLVGQGIAGELYIGGAGLARGYLNRADLTAEKFILNPFYDKTNPSSSERLYKTGDLVRWLPDGNLEYLGRIDHQVKIRGFRIELGEIESTLAAHVDVKDAIVLTKESATGEKRLVAYVTTNAIDMKDESDLSISAGHALINDLRNYLGKTLPDYMVPSVFVLLDSLPLTPNGKVDRKALPEPDISTLQNTYIAPRSETEKVLCEIWQDVLGAERVGITDDFFQLGGHSLLAMKLIAKLQHVFAVNIPVKTLFHGQVVAELAEIIDKNILIQNNKHMAVLDLLEEIEW